jgi:hypothetical protein
MIQPLDAAFFKIKPVFDVKTGFLKHSRNRTLQELLYMRV